MRLRPRFRGTSLLLVLLASGCASEREQDDDDVADDDDAVDDEDAADDDDSTPDPSVLDPSVLDLADPGLVVAAVLRTTEIRYPFASYELGRHAGDDTCPAVAVDGGTTTYTGGCDAGTGYRFEGSLVVVDEVPEPGVQRAAFAAEGWRVEGTGQGFAALGLDGTAEYTEAVVDDVHTEAVRFRGTVEFDPGTPTTLPFAPVLSGSYSFARLASADVVGLHEYAGDFVLPGGAAWTITALMDEAEGLCFKFTALSQAHLESGDRSADVHVGADPDPCDHCWPWSLDGEAQPELACIELD